MVWFVFVIVCDLFAWLCICVDVVLLCALFCLLVGECVLLCLCWFLVCLFVFWVVFRLGSSSVVH